DRSGHGGGDGHRRGGGLVGIARRRQRRGCAARVGEGADVGRGRVHHGNVRQGVVGDVEVRGDHAGGVPPAGGGGGPRGRGQPAGTVVEQHADRAGAAADVRAGVGDGHAKAAGPAGVGEVAKGDRGAVGATGQERTAGHRREDRAAIVEQHADVGGV